MFVSIEGHKTQIKPKRNPYEKKTEKLNEKQRDCRTEMKTATEEDRKVNRE